MVVYRIVIIYSDAIRSFLIDRPTWELFKNHGSKINDAVNIATLTINTEYYNEIVIYGDNYDWTRALRALTTSQSYLKFLSKNKLNLMGGYHGFVDTNFVE